MFRKFFAGAVALSAVFAAACDSSSNTAPSFEAALSNGGGGSGGGANSGTSLTFLVADAGIAPSGTVSFYAKQGEERTGEIFAAGVSGGNGDRLVRLRVRKDADIVLPNGTRLATGDSVLITMQVIDGVTLATDFQPSGLRFTGRKADLTLFYGHTNAAAAPTIESRLAIYVQEFAGDVWKKVSSAVSSEIDEVEAKIPGFSNYVIAF